MRTLLLALLSFSLIVRPSLASVTQKTHGQCSPAVADVKGDVTIVCQGVDPKALERLNELLDVLQEKDLTEKLNEAEEWARKYHELQARMAELGESSLLSKRAKQLIEEGKFEDAGALLDELLAKEEKEVARIAANHFSRAQLYDLQFQPQHALPHYAEAYRYRPGNLEYATAYAVTLYEQNHFAEGIEVSEETLKAYRELAQPHSAAYQANVGIILNNLAALYRETKKFAEAEAAVQEALALYRDLAMADPATYKPDVAHTLINLANFYRETERLDESEAALKKALALYRDLATTDPATYKPDVALTLSNLALLHTQTKNYAEAEAAVQEALSLYQDLAKTNPAAYQPQVARTLIYQGFLLTLTQKPAKAEAAFQKAVTINRDLAAINPDKFLPDLALSLSRLAVFYIQYDPNDKAYPYALEAAELYSKLSRKNPAVYGDNFALTVMVLARSSQADESAPTAICTLARESEQAATKQQYKEQAQELMMETCESGQSPD